MSHLNTGNLDMARHTRIFILIVALVVLAAMTSRAQSDPGTPDTVRVDSVVTYTISGSVVVPVYLTNDEPLSLVEVTLVHRSDDIVLDSISFTGTRLQNASFPVKRTLSDTTLTFGASPSVEIPAGSGIVGKLFFSFESTIAPQVVIFDTITVTTPEQIVFANTLKSGNDPVFVPQFVPGNLEIQEPPPTLDSVWVDDGSTEPGQSFAVDLNLYNERNLLSLIASLDYGSDYIKIDSAVVNGFRGGSAISRVFTPNSSLNRLRLDLGWTEGTPLAPGSGTLARLYFTADSAAIDTALTIDTAVGQPNLITFTASAGGDQIVPIFNPGIVTIQIPTDVGDGIEIELPASFSLAQNYPNPFNPTTYIEFNLPAAGHVSLEVFNILGQQVRSLLDQEMPAGFHRVVFNGRNASGDELSTGVYLYRLKTDDYVASRKMILMK